MDHNYSRKSNTKDARPPLAVLTYTLDQACLSYKGTGEDSFCPPTVLCQHQPVAATFEIAHNLLIAKNIRKMTCRLILRLQGPIQ